jgi:hypothetical protein
MQQPDGKDSCFLQKRLVFLQSDAVLSIFRNPIFIFKFFLVALCFIVDFSAMANYSNLVIDLLTL